MNRTNPPSYHPVQTGEGSYILHAVVAGVAFLTCCWPYLIWHGEDRYGRMVWDTSSWTACLLWWLGVTLIVFMSWGLSRVSRNISLREVAAVETPELRRLRARYSRLQRQQFRQDNDLRAHALREETWL
jgi:hypothetical protein